jgi:hypothetical protein
MSLSVTHLYQARWRLARLPLHSRRSHPQQRHGGPADDEDIRNYTTAGQALAQGSERPLQVGPAQKDIAGFAHAASRSLADRYTPCLRKAA